MNILRAGIFHTPDADTLVSHPDGGLAIAEGRIADCGDFAAVRNRYPEATVRDLRPGFLLPGFIDTHIHYPQVRIVGGLGHTLLDWLDRLTLPEEAKLADDNYAAVIADEFVANLAAHGTTTALVFGSHFPNATATLFEAAHRTGLRIVSGLVLADRLLRPDLHTTPEAAYQSSRDLIRRFHRNGLLRYAVTPRFALSAGEALLEVCQSLLAEDPSLAFTTHINENPREIAEVAGLFPWASDYLAIYERFGLVGRRSVLAHNVHASDSELARFAHHGASVAHCPCSNAALGSGIFPMRRHLAHGVHFALGTDVGAGTGFGMMKEALQSYLLQRVAPDPLSLSPGRMLYLATRAGAEALALENETGDFTPGKSADFVMISHPALLNTSPDLMLARILTLSESACIREVRVADRLVFEGAHED